MGVMSKLICRFSKLLQHMASALALECDISPRVVGHCPADITFSRSIARHRHSSTCYLHYEADEGTFDCSVPPQPYQLAVCNAVVCRASAG